MNEATGPGLTVVVSENGLEADHPVPTAWKDGGHTVATGNSFAAPHITGLLALLYAKHPGFTPFEAKAILAATADNAVS